MTVCELNYRMTLFEVMGHIRTIFTNYTNLMFQGDFTIYDQDGDQSIQLRMARTGICGGRYFLNLNLRRYPPANIEVKHCKNKCRYVKETQRFITIVPQTVSNGKDLKLNFIDENVTYSYDCIPKVYYA